MDDHKKQYIPFDFYDFFGYLFPGFYMALIIGLILHYYNYEKLINIESNLLVENEFSLIQYLILIVAAIIILYLLGHLVATLGSLILERIFHYGIFDSPIFYLLKIHHKPRPFVTATYKYMFLFSNIIILLAIFIDQNLIQFIIKILFYILILVITLKLAIEFSRYYKLFNTIMDKIDKRLRFIEIVFVSIPNYIVNPILEFIRALVNNNKPFKDDFIEIYGKIFNKKFSLEYDKADEENLWLSIYDISVNSSIHFGIIRTWHHLSGFSRNIACASYIGAFTLCFLMLKYPGENIHYLRLGLILSDFIAIVFFLRYLNLNQNYYIKNILRVFVAENSKQ